MNQSIFALIAGTADYESACDCIPICILGIKNLYLITAYSSENLLPMQLSWKENYSKCSTVQTETPFPKHVKQCQRLML